MPAPLSTTPSASSLNPQMPRDLRVDAAGFASRAVGRGTTLFGQASVGRGRWHAAGLLACVREPPVGGLHDTDWLHSPRGRIGVARWRGAERASAHARGCAHRGRRVAERCGGVAGAGCVFGWALRHRVFCVSLRNLLGATLHLGHARNCVLVDEGSFVRGARPLFPTVSSHVGRGRSWLLCVAPPRYELLHMPFRNDGLCLRRFVGTWEHSLEGARGAPCQFPN